MFIGLHFFNTHPKNKIEVEHKKVGGQHISSVSWAVSTAVAPQMSWTAKYNFR